MNPATILKSFARNVRERGLGSAIKLLARRASIRRKESFFSINTEAVVFLPELGIDNPDCNEYQATDYDVFDTMIQGLDIEPAEHVFLDYGAGMGRAMVLAATYPFKKVLGVEIAPELAAIGQRNIDQCRSKVRCQDITLTNEDATRHVPDPDVTLCYFNNSFTGEVLESVLRNVKQFSTEQHPVLLVCNLPKRSPFEDQITKHDGLNLKKEFTLSSIRKCLVFST